MNRALIITAFVIACISFAQVSASNETLSEFDKQKIIKTAEELRGAILRKDIEVVLKHISKDGLGCTDTQISRSVIKKYLYDKNSYLYMSLFDTQRFFAKCKSHYPMEFPAISDKEFFLGAKDGQIEVLPLGRNTVKVIFKSSVKGHYQREYDFQKEENEWKLIYGFIVGSCSCG